jgi:hypothetical protein
MRGEKTMNIKKLVGAVSALTIAASTFAGLAVTASAADTTTIGPITYEDEGSSVLFKDYSRTTVSKESADGTNTGSYEKILTSGSGMSGSGYTFANADDTKNSVVTISFDAAMYLRPRLSLRSTVPGTSNRDEADTNRIFTIGETNDSGVQLMPYGYISKVADAAWAHYEFTVDCLKGKTSFKIYDYVDGATDYSEQTALYDVSDVAFRDTTVNSVTSFDYYSANTNSYVKLDNLKITIVPPETLPDPAGDLTIKYVDGSNNEIAQSTSANVENKYVGDTYSYSYPAYIVGEDGKLYKCDTEIYTDSVTLTADSQEKEVKYTVQDASVFQYVEYDGTTSIANAEKASNGAMTSNFGTASLTVENDGIYTVIFGTGRNTQEASAARYGTWKVNDGETTDVLFSGPNPGPQEFNNISLSANDVISITQKNSKCSLDYILIIKTANLPTTVNATNIGVYNDDEVLGTNGVATVFKAEMGDVTGTLNFAVTSNDVTKTFEGATTLTDANAVLGIIVTGLSDADATGVLTVVE